MKQLGKKIGGLIIDIVLFAYKMSKQVVVPTKKRKGNVLSSLLVFFIGIIERLNHFEHGFFNMAIILKQKHIKKGILIIGVILFFLASFEWTQERKIENNTSSACTEQFSKTAATGTATIKSQQIVAYSAITALNKQNPVPQRIPQQFNALSSSVKKYLFIHSLRI